MAPPRRPEILWFWSVAVLVAAIGANLGAPVIAAGAVKGSLRTLLGTTQVDVALEARPPLALWWGSVGRMTVFARDVQTGDLRLDRFDATFQRVRVDPRALYADRMLVIRAVESGRARGAMSQEALARAFSRQPGVRVDMLAFRSGSVFVRGTVRVLGTAVAVDGRARLVLNGRDSIDLILDRTTVAGVGPAAAIRGQLTTRVSSVLRIPALPLGLQLTNVRVEDGRLLLDAATGPS